MNSSFAGWSRLFSEAFGKKPTGSWLFVLGTRLQKNLKPDGSGGILGGAAK